MAVEMGSSSSPSALQSLLSTHDQTSSNPQEQRVLQLALQIAHNLKYQHSWTNLRLHTTSTSGNTLPQPIISGLPPQPLYIHPDEQIEFLQKQKDNSSQPTGAQLQAQREWVLSSHLRSKWTLRKFGEVFNVISALPPDDEGQLLFQDGTSPTGNSAGDDRGAVNEDWRALSKTPKRVLLATVDDDSTVVYYIVHDGVVKPRQN